jgi:hypothetical protein
MVLLVAMVGVIVIARGRGAARATGVEEES